jgi:hypothetical protein
MRERVPRIARETSGRNADFSPAVHQAIEQLASDIERDAPLPVPPAPGPDVDGWVAACAEHGGETWLDTEWFFAELLFYRALGHACRYWETGRDPFAPAKEEELAGDSMWKRLDTALSIGGDASSRLQMLLALSLWGNRVDLSYTVAVGHGEEQRGDDLLVDDRHAASALLEQGRGAVHVVADNTGTELALDLALIDAVLGLGATVTLHLKMDPVFVSDAMPADVWRLVAAMASRGGAASALAGRLQAAFAEGRLRLAPDPFWSSPRFLWQAPPHLASTLASASVVLIKGDANYRRAVGDAIWPESRSFAEACAGLPFRMVCLRTLKSDSVVGLPAGTAARLDALDPQWRINGRRGVIQAR